MTRGELTAIEGLEGRLMARFDGLEARIDALEIDKKIRDGVREEVSRRNSSLRTGFMTVLQVVSVLVAALVTLGILQPLH